ncbi:putative glutamate receptor ionotropic, delta-2-like 30, partial [Homarus americanus]
GGTTVQLLKVTEQKIRRPPSSSILSRVATSRNTMAATTTHRMQQQHQQFMTCKTPPGPSAPDANSHLPPLIITPTVTFHTLLLLIITCPTASSRDLREGGMTTAARQQVEGVISQAVELVLPLLAQGTSALIVHDGSPDALEVTHRLASRLSVPLQVGDMSRLLEHPATLAAFQKDQHNSDLGLTVFVFSNVSVVGKFVTVKSHLWVTTPLLLLSLSLYHDAREVLVEVQQVRWSALLQAQHTPSGRFTHSLFTFLPFNPPDSQFHIQVYNEEMPLTRGRVFVERYLDFHGWELKVASWIDDFPFLFYDSSK